MTTATETACILLAQRERQPARLVLLALALLLALPGCGRPGAETSGNAPGQPARSEAPKRLHAAIRGDPHTLYQALNPNNNIPGIDALQELVGAGLAEPDHQGIMRPQLAEAVPSLENGLWQLLP